MTKDRFITMDQVDLRFLKLRSPTALAIKNMAESLKKQGQLTPVVLTGEERPYILIDGFKRYLAAQSLGLESIKAIFIHAELTQAKIMMYLMNRKEGLSYIQEALLIRELVDQDGLKQTQVARLLDHHKSWVNRRLMVIRGLGPEILEDLSLELLPTGAAVPLSRVAPCNQTDLSAAIVRHNLNLKEIHMLIDLWCKTREPAEKQFLLQAPKEALALLNEELAGLSALKNVRKLISVLKKRLALHDKNAQLKSYLLQIKSEIHDIEQILNGEEK